LAFDVDKIDTGALLITFKI